MSESGTPADKVEQIQSRTSPRKMALPAIWDEIDELQQWARDATDEEIHYMEDRFGDISHWLQSRLDVEYPDCPECGGHVARTEEGDVICWERHHELPDDVLEEYERVDGRLWGTRGHNGGAR